MIVQRYTVIDGREAARYWVHPRIMVGGEFISAADAQHVHDDFGLTHSLSLQIEADRDDTGKFPGPCFRYAFWDDAQPIDPTIVRGALTCAEEILQDPKAKLYVHCQLGGSRSPSMAYGILRWAFKYPEDEAMRLVVEGREDFQCARGDWRTPGNWHPHPHYKRSIDAVILARGAGK